MGCERAAISGLKATLPPADSASLSGSLTLTGFSAWPVRGSLSRNMSHHVCLGISQVGEAILNLQLSYT